MLASLLTGSSFNFLGLFQNLPYRLSFDTKNSHSFPSKAVRGYFAEKNDIVEILAYGIDANGTRILAIALLRDLGVHHRNSVARGYG